MISARVATLFGRAVLAPLAALCLIVSAWAEPGPRESVKLLTIGNSFANNAIAFLPRFAEAGGKTLVVFPANLGGASFNRHAGHLRAFEANPHDGDARPYKDRVHPRTGEKRDFSLREALEADAWDFVTIQQVSNHSHRFETFEPAAGEVIAYVRKHAPQAVILIHQTWAYREDYPGYGQDGLTPETMHRGLVAAYDRLAADYGLGVIPVGEAFYAARHSPRWTFRFPDPDFDYTNPPAGRVPGQRGSLNTGWRWTGSGGERRLVLDHKHANDAGKYLAGAVFYQVLFGEPVPESAGPVRGLTEDDAADLRRIARETVLSRK